MTRRLPRYPSLPAGLIGRSAIDRGFQHLRLGSLLIVDAAARALRAEPAIYVRVVDAKNEDVAAFYMHLGFRRFLGQAMPLFIPISEMALRLSR